nr:unnamed protein product [Callosobruchus analis]
MGILGDDPNKQNKPTYTIHQAVASRWNNFIAKGLSDDELAKMTDTYTIPSNVILTTPKINPEIVSFLNGQQKAKDSFHENYHRQVAIGMSALGQGLNVLLESSMETETKELILKHLNDADRCLASLSHNITYL